MHRPSRCSGFQRSTRTSSLPLLLQSGRHSRLVAQGEGFARRQRHPEQVPHQCVVRHLQDRQDRVAQPDSLGQAPPQCLGLRLCHDGGNRRQVGCIAALSHRRTHRRPLGLCLRGRLQQSTGRRHSHSLLQAYLRGRVRRPTAGDCALGCFAVQPGEPALHRCRGTL